MIDLYTSPTPNGWKAAMMLDVYYVATINPLVIFGASSSALMTRVLDLCCISGTRDAY